MRGSPRRVWDLNFFPSFFFFFFVSQTQMLLFLLFRLYFGFPSLRIFLPYGVCDFHFWGNKEVFVFLRFPKAFGVGEVVEVRLGISLIQSC